MSTDIDKDAVDVLRSKLNYNGKDISTADATKSCVAELLAKIKRFQIRVQKHIEDNYVDYIPNQTINDLYLKEGDTLISETRHVLLDAGWDANEALRAANDELVVCVDELREVTLGLRVTYRILKVDDLFQCIEEANATKEYMVVLDLLGKLQNLVICSSFDEGESAEVRVFQKCKCFQNITVKYHIQVHLLQQNLEQRFERLVKFTEKQYPNNKCVTLQVSKDVNELQETVMALFQAKFNPNKICNFLLENCFQPMIMKPVSIEYNEDDQQEFVKLTISYALNDLGAASLRPSYKHVFENIKQLLHVIENINVLVNAEQHVFSIIGEHINQQFIQLLVNECLMYAIPETMDEFEESSVVEDVVHFEQLLADAFLINIDTDRALCEFRNKFDSYFHSRFSRKLLESAKAIMQKDLQDMTTIAEKNTEEDVKNNPLLFPSCMVSRSTLEIIKLLEGILRLPSEVDGLTEGYPSVVAAILNAYVNQVPNVHEKLLKIIPQQAALFHNNCLFLSHWVSKNADKGIPVFAALVKTLQSTGTKYLNFQTTNQKEILLNILKELDLTDPHTIGTTPQKLIRQCMRQLDVLRNVWQNVLPDKVYNETFCNLLQAFCSEVIKQILNMEDISAKVATELSELIDIILSKTPTLFQDKRGVVHIPCWMKLEQLKFILMASLQEITEQWCDGMGILTANYSADDIRHLIRALFQNTDRRATALMKIC